jgi:hypothetical protein
MIDRLNAGPRTTLPLSRPAIGRRNAAADGGTRALDEGEKEISSLAFWRSITAPPARGRMVAKDRHPHQPEAPVLMLRYPDPIRLVRIGEGDGELKNVENKRVLGPIQLAWMGNKISSLPP